MGENVGKGDTTLLTEGRVSYFVACRLIAASPAACLRRLGLRRRDTRGGNHIIFEAKIMYTGTFECCLFCSKKKTL